MTDTSGPTTVPEIEADIARHRAELADTVDQLAARLDVKTRVRERLVTDDGRPTTTALAVGGAAAFVLTALIARAVIRRSHR